MNRLWLFHSPKGVFGPFTIDQLNRFRENGLLLPSSVLQNSKTGETIQATNLPELFGSTEATSSDTQNLSCKVRFDSFSSGRDPSFKGKGKASVNDACLTITGRPNRLFAFRQREESIPLNQILNVSTEGKLLRFRVEGDKKNSPSRILRFANREEAANFAKKLPTRLSPEVAQAKADAEVYAKFLRNNGRPYVTYALVSLNLLIFILCVMAGIDWLTGKTNLWLKFGGNFALSTAAGQWWRLFTAMFLHAGIAHVLLNMWALWDAGKVAERIFGHKQYALLYLMSGIMGGMASINWQQDVVSVGASGAVFGIYGALVAALMLRKDLLPCSVTTQMRNSALVFITYALFNGFTKSGIDNAAHLGGLIAGAVIGAGYVISVRRAYAASISLIVLLTIGGAARAIEIANDYRDELRFREFMVRLGEEERRLNNLTHSLLKEASKMPKDEFLREFDSSIVQGWGAQENEIATLVKLTNRSRSICNTVSEFIHLKHESLMMMSDGIRYDESWLIDASKNKVEEANSILARLNKKPESGKQ